MRPPAFGCPRRRAAIVRARRAGFPVPDQCGSGPVRHYGAETIAVVVAVASIAAAAVSAYGAYQAGQQQQAVFEYNALVARQQAQYQSQAAEIEARLLERQAAGVLTMAEAEAALAEQQALAAQTAGDIRERQIRRAYDRTQSEVRVAIGKAGVDTTGSPLMVLLENADTAGEELAINDYRTALDVAGAEAEGSLARAEAHFRAQSLRSESGFRRFAGANAASGSLAEANLLRFQAGGLRSATALNVGTTLLSGVAAASTPFLRYGRAA